MENYKKRPNGQKELLIPKLQKKAYRQKISFPGCTFGWAASRAKAWQRKKSSSVCCRRVGWGRKTHLRKFLRWGAAQKLGRRKGTASGAPCAPPRRAREKRASSFAKRLRRGRPRCRARGQVARPLSWRGRREKPASGAVGRRCSVCGPNGAQAAIPGAASLPWQF